MASRLISNLRNIPRQTLKKVIGRRSASTLSAFEQTLHNAPETEMTATANGLRVASENSGGETCTVGLWVDTGSRFENNSNNGITLFLEHMIYKGTTNKSQLQLEAEVESMGASFNAYTSREQTAYYAKCFKKDLPAVVGILGDVIQNPRFDEATIESQREVILKEMQEVESDVERVSFDHLHATAYQGTPLAYSVYGPTENVYKVTKDDLHDYVKTHFTTPRIALAAAGGVDHQTLVQLAEENFSGLATGINPEGKIQPCRFTGSEVRDRNDFLPYAHVTLAIEGCGWANPDYFPLMVMTQVIGSWSRSLDSANSVFGFLPQETHRLHSAEAYNAFNICYTDTGLFGVHFVSDRMELDNMAYNIQTEWLRMCTHISDADVARAKAALKTNMLSAESHTATCEEIGRQLLAYGRRMPLHEVNKRIDMVDTSTVKKAANKYIYDKCPVTAGVGPVEGMTDYNRLRSGMYWLRV